MDSIISVDERKPGKRWINEKKSSTAPKRIRRMEEDIKSFDAMTKPKTSASSISPKSGSVSPYSKKYRGESDSFASSSTSKFVRSFSNTKSVDIGINSDSKIRDPDLLKKIANTIGFVHHEGTDIAAEMSVVKTILTRENLIMKLKYLCNSLMKINNINSNKNISDVLSVLSQLRESTLNYLEALCYWRQAAYTTSSTSPLQSPPTKIFIWEGQNYSLKVINDLDFLVENNIIVNSLNIQVEQFLSNPLMLSNNLFDSKTTMDPYESAVSDCNGRNNGADFETRIRLRFAERLLLQELEVSNKSAANRKGSFSPIKPIPIDQKGNQAHII